MDVRPASDRPGRAPHRALLPSDITRGPWDALGASLWLEGI